LIGPSNVKEILFEGRILEAAEAKAMGLVNRVVPDAEVVAESYATAARIAEGAPLAARWHKKFIHRLRDATPLTDADHLETYACFDTEDFRTGYQAFLAKRKPEFEGR
jgi:enoyl-CoA hydratase/carnithine racemase